MIEYIHETKWGITQYAHYWKPDTDYEYLSITEIRVSVERAEFQSKMCKQELIEPIHKVDATTLEELLKSGESHLTQ